MNRPFLQLPNVIGSPHSSASIANALDFALRSALANCRRAALGQTPLHLLKPDERMR
jgi:phosphoglycerate dehydrogenase-like enzyme